MAHRRMIASDIFEDEWYGQLDFFQQQLWIGLFAKCADDQGRLQDNAALLRAAIFPYKDIPLADIEIALVSFAKEGKITRYVAQGKKLLQIARWWKNQRPQWAQPSKWQAPSGWIDHVRAQIQGKYITINWPPQGDDMVCPPEQPTPLPQEGIPGEDPSLGDSLNQSLDLASLNQSLDLAKSVSQSPGEETDRPTDSGDGEGLPSFPELESEVRYAVSLFEPGREDASLIMRAYKLWDSTLGDGQRMREDDFIATMSRARGATLAKRNADKLNTTHAMEYYMACLENTLKAMATIQAEGP
jgi:hypothetical protein